MSEETKYYIQDTRTYCGNSVMWWRINGCGYTSNLDEAWKVTKEQAKNRGIRKTDKLWPCEEIDAKSERHFDIQKLREIKDANAG